ncbi:hypothetical protein DEO72_LG6g1829 [Vigna unguiculata]|uniref:Uncharacterized protein n=1 Tax=Vigna unguiculata TaxID=3917 RepID=A0A4D6M6V9_VIGUN|nr:hypothetical protein DEO72_LG6g1829 [Vigna unguiculata]
MIGLDFGDGEKESFKLSFSPSPKSNPIISKIQHPISKVRSFNEGRYGSVAGHLRRHHHRAHRRRGDMAEAKGLWFTGVARRCTTDDKRTPPHPVRDSGSPVLLVASGSPSLSSLFEVPTLSSSVRSSDSPATIISPLFL